MRVRRSREPDDRGSAPVEFVLVGTMLTFLTLGVLQFGFAVYVRNVVHDAAVDCAYRLLRNRGRGERIDTAIAATIHRAATFCFYP